MSIKSKMPKQTSRKKAITRLDPNNFEIIHYLSLVFVLKIYLLLKDYESYLIKIKLQTPILLHD